jgi:hypothetical protein
MREKVFSKSLFRNVNTVRRAVFGESPRKQPPHKEDVKRFEGAAICNLQRRQQ